MLSINNLTYKRGSRVILDNLSYTFKPGSITCIVGPSGIGKSTLLSCIAQLYTDYEGSISINDTPLKSLSNNGRAQAIGMVFQQWNLFPLLSARENIAQPLQVVGNQSKQEALVKADKLLKTFGMESYGDYYSSQLSGGQQQRIALARALGLQPKILCLDEPTSSLDAENTKLLIQELKKLKREGITLVIASHDRQFVEEIADTIVELSTLSSLGNFP